MRLPATIFAALLLVFALPACDPDVSAPVREACDARGAEPIDVSLDPGESYRLPTGYAHCLRLPGGSGEYALAYTSSRWITVESRGVLPGDPPRDFTIEIGGAKRPVSLSRTDAADESFGLAPPPEPIVIGDAALRAGSIRTPYPPTRDRPWVVGEEARINDPIDGVERPIRVHQVHDDYLVVASITDKEMPTLDRTLAQIDSARHMLTNVGVPLLEEVFPGDRPLTSSASNQILLLIHPDIREEMEGAVGVMFRYIYQDDFWTVLAVSPNDPESRRTPVSLSDLVVHELAHAFQFRHQYEHTGRQFGERWGIEGGATLMQYEYVRRLAGGDLFDNYDWRRPASSQAEVRHQAFLVPGSGRVAGGYTPAAQFLKDQVRRRILAGDEITTALREISQNVTGGWAPLTLTQQDRLAPDWHPANAILTWTLSRAADDRTDSPVYQDQGQLRAWDVYALGRGWSETARMYLGLSPPIRAENRPGGTGYVYLQVSDEGGELGLQSTLPWIEWEILRIR